MGCSTHPEVDDTPTLHRRPARTQKDIDVMVLQELAIERVDGLVDRFLDGEQQAGAIGIVANPLSFGVRCYDGHKVPVERLVRFNINSQPGIVTPQRDCGHSYCGIVGQRSNNVTWPQWNARRGLRDGLLRMSQALQKLARNDTRRAARPSNSGDT